MTLQHVGIEVDPAEIDRSVEFFGLLGFVPVDPPPSLADSFTWVEKDGTQVHLMHERRGPDRRDGAPPGRAHIAIVVADFEMTLARLQEHGFEVERRAEHWGAPRALAIAPGGHRVELMAAAP